MPLFFGLFLVIVLSALSTALVSLVCTQIQLLGSSGPIAPRATADPTCVPIGIYGANKPNPEAAVLSGNMPFIFYYFFHAENDRKIPILCSCPGQLQSEGAVSKHCAGCNPGASPNPCWVHGFGVWGEVDGSHPEPFPPVDGGIALLHHPQCPSWSQTGRARTVGWQKPGIRAMLCCRMLSSPSAGDTKAGGPQPIGQGTLGTTKPLMGTVMAAWRGPCVMPGCPPRLVGQARDPLKDNPILLRSGNPPPALWCCCLQPFGPTAVTICASVSPPQAAHRPPGLGFQPCWRGVTKTKPYKLHCHDMQLFPVSGTAS